MWRPWLCGIAVLLLAAPSAAGAQEVSLSFGADGSLAARSIQLFFLITVLSIVPGLAIMITCFPFIVTVLSIMRQGIGLQQSPPNMLIVSLALFLTYFVMEPVFQEAWSDGGAPLVQRQIEIEDAAPIMLEPFRRFMAARVDPQTLAEMEDLRAIRPAPGEPPTLSVLIPSFLLSETTRAFQVGFLIFLPFLIIDLVVAAVLMSMGMMMVPPAIVSLPFKLAFIVVTDAWSLVAQSLVRGYG